MSPIRVGGVFSGIGAHVSACDRLDPEGTKFKHVFQCEFDPKTESAFNIIHNNHNPIINLGDIRNVENIGGPLQVDILFWTPPCQDISLAGRQAGNEKGSGTRSSLAFEVPRIIKATKEDERPKYLIMEEVPTMISKKFINNFNELLDELSILGYWHSYGIMNAADYGVAQSRKRCFVISKLGSPAPELPKPKPLFKCLKDYLEPEPVAEHYYLSEDRLKGLIWSNQKEEENGNNFRFSPTEGGGTAHSITSRAGSRKTDNFYRTQS